MATVYPDRVYQKPHAGQTAETKVLSLLTKLPDDCIVYYEPTINHRTPDYIVYLPNIGLLVLEVKSIKDSSIIDGNANTLKIKSASNAIKIPINVTHPIKQAKDYVFKLRETLLNDRLSTYLVNAENHHHQGKLIFPLAYGVVLSNITFENIDALSIQHSPAYFPISNTIFKNELADFDKEEIDPNQLKEYFKKFFITRWNFSASSKQVIIMHSIISHTSLDILKQDQKLLSLLPSDVDLEEISTLFNEDASLNTRSDAMQDEPIEQSADDTQIQPLDQQDNTTDTITITSELIESPTLVSTTQDEPPTQLEERTPEINQITPTDQENFQQTVDGFLSYSVKLNSDIENKLYQYEQIKTELKSLGYDLPKNKDSNLTAKELPTLQLEINKIVHNNSATELCPALQNIINRAKAVKLTLESSELENSLTLVQQKQQILQDKFVKIAKVLDIELNT